MSDIKDTLKQSQKTRAKAKDARTKPDSFKVMRERAVEYLKEKKVDASELGDKLDQLPHECRFDVILETLRLLSFQLNQGNEVSQGVGDALEGVISEIEEVKGKLNFSLDGFAL